MPLKSTIFEQKHHIHVEKHDIYNIIVSKRFTGTKKCLQHIADCYEKFDH